MMRQVVLSVIAGGLVLGTMAVALAQPQRMGPGMGPGQGPGPGMPMMQGQGPMMHRGGPGMGHGMGMMGFEHIEGRIAFLAAELKITDQQRPQWDAFAKALRANAQAHKALHETMTAQSVTSWPDRLGLMEQMMAARLDQIKALKGAATPLYAVLTKEQKEVADDLMRGPMGMH